jgi:hypothetical protein
LPENPSITKPGKDLILKTAVTNQNSKRAEEVIFPPAFYFSEVIVRDAASQVAGAMEQ